MTFSKKEVRKHICNVTRLSAHWGYGSKYDGERYELQLCEKCFFYALATLRKERADEFMFDENFDPSTLEGLGLK